MARYEFKCTMCGRVTEVARSMQEGPGPDFRCVCDSGMMQRVWTVPETMIREPLKRGSGYGVALPGVNLARRSGRSAEAQEQRYTKHINFKRHLDTREKLARGTSRKKLDGVRFERVGSMPRELVVGESRSAGNRPAGELMKEHGKAIMKKHGCYWGDK